MQHSLPPKPEVPSAPVPNEIPHEGRLQTFELRRSEGSHIGRFASIEVAAYAGLEPHAGSILHSEEMRYFLPLPAKRRRVSFLLGRYAAKRALGPSLGNPTFDSINIAPGIFNNPVVCYPMEYPWQVSISHSDSLVCAIAFPMVHPMALDVESIDAEKVSVMSSQCQDCEQAELSRHGLDLTAASTVLWTAKEALSKILCTGMMCPFEVFSVHSITRPALGEFEGLYKNLAQYKFHSWIFGNSVLTITLPRKTDFFFDTGQPCIRFNSTGAGR